MKDIKIAMHSAYIPGSVAPYSDAIRKLYKGIKVYVSVWNDSVDFKIITKSLKVSLWKRACEPMKFLTFDDASLSVTCDFENEPKNKCPHTLQFEKEVYDELKENIPVFMKECGAKFEVCAEETKKVLKF